MFATKKYISTIGILLLLLCTRLSLSQSTNQNFIKKTIPVTAVTSETSLDNLGWSSKIESINYFDGLGRPIQNVIKKGSPTSLDAVQFTNYDEQGRTPVSYLPYVDNTMDGSFKTNTLTNQANFYTNTFMVAHTNTPFSETVYDGSPLNKVTETSAPDTDWQLGAGHTSKVEESANAANEVRLFQLTGGDCVSSSFYNANELTVTKVTDPNGGIAYTFKDKMANTILHKKLIKVFKTTYTYAYTYYVHDDFGNVAYIISPKAYDLMVTNSNYSVNALTQDLVYKYKYDERNRLIERKVPGINWHYIVYNKLNQVVLTQDGNLTAQNKWNYFKYDVLGRLIMTGLFDVSSLPLFQTRASAQAQFDANQDDIGESEMSGTTFGYSNNTLPKTNTDPLAIYYYDDYDFDNNGTTDYTFDANSVPCITFGYTVCTPFTISATTRTRGYLTGTKTKVMDAANPVQWINSASFYNTDGLLVQKQENDHMGATDLSNYLYDFTGNLVHYVLKHNEQGGNQIQIINHFTYDRMGRITRVDQKNNTDDPIVLSKEKYNQLGQLIDKSVHSTDNAVNFIQSMDFRYNIHGWLTNINHSDLANDMGFVDPETGLPPNDGLNDDAGDLWGMQLNYNATTTNITSGGKQYNGNVTEKYWRSATDNVKRGYGYTYDKGDRLTASTYTEFNNTTLLWGQNPNRYNENSITYDANGNMLTLKRTGYQSTSTFGEIDNLTYTYNGNFLTCVNDASVLHAPTQGSNDFKDNGSVTNGEYTYDVNGNQTANANKGITSITYNHLNLPTVINFTGGDKLEYFYDAAGTKLRKKKTQGSTITNVKYSGIFEYNENVLAYFHTMEGRCMPSGVSSPAFKYEYHYTDNTGNVVLAFSDIDNNGTINPATEVIQQSHYYAFGVRMLGTGVPLIGVEHKYKFGGKEFQDEFSLNEYDFGARNYDPAIARWNNIDPLAEVAPNWTPFRYGFNNPITITDPTGMLEDEFTADTDDDKKKKQQNSGNGGGNREFKQTIYFKQPAGDLKAQQDPVASGSTSVSAEVMQKINTGLPSGWQTPMELRGGISELKEYKQPASEQAFTAISELGDAVSSNGNYAAGTVINALWNMNNDAFVGANWIFNRSMKDLTGHSEGRQHSQDAAFNLIMTIFTLPIGGIEGELVQGAKTTVIGKMDDLARFSDDAMIDTWHKSGIKGKRVTWADNKAWLDSKITRGDKFGIATDPKTLPPVRNGYIPGKPNGYFTARELQYLESKGIIVTPMH